MDITIFGMGYVGTVTAACLADDGHTVIGVDPNEFKIETINNGRAPMVESGVDELISRNVQAGRLTATTDSAAAVTASDVIFVCVGTPSRPNGSLDLQFLERACTNIGVALQKADHHVVVVVRSTMLPGTMNDVVIPLLETHSNKRSGRDFGVCVNPEFLREATAVQDFRCPPKIVVGSNDQQTIDVVRPLVERGDAPLAVVPLEIAEMVKYVDNSWHALKVTFANEIGRIAKSFDLDSHQIMDVFFLDDKLNISTSYLTPGMAFGGSCLPKDVRALTHKAREMDIDLPVLHSVTASNQAHLNWARDQVLAHDIEKVSILGLSFKAGTDDLREAPMVDLAEQLIGKGRDVRIYDEHVHIQRLTGANQSYINAHLAHLERLLVDDLDTALKHGELLVVGNKSPAFADLAQVVGPNQLVIDMVRVISDPAPLAGYEGLLW